LARLAAEVVKDIRINVVAIRDVTPKAISEIAQSKRNIPAATVCKGVHLRAIKNGATKRM